MEECLRGKDGTAGGDARSTGRRGRLPYSNAQGQERPVFRTQGGAGLEELRLVGGFGPVCQGQHVKRQALRVALLIIGCGMAQLLA